MLSGADLNDDNLRISKAYLRISDHCRVTVRAAVWVRIRVLVRIGLGLQILSVRFNGHFPGELGLAGIY